MLLLGKATTLALGFAAGVFPLIGAADRPGSNPLPDGIYKYVIIDGGKPSGTSTIRVSLERRGRY